MPTDRHRLGQGGDVGLQPVGDGHHQRLLDEHLVRIGAGGVHREADHVDPLAPSQQRQRDDAGAGRRGLAAAGAVLGDFAAELVAEDDLLVGPRKSVIAGADGKLCPLVAPRAGVEIGTADPAT